MKKLKVIVAALGLLLIGNASMAQKIGYIDAETILLLTPEAAKVDSLMQIYQRDTVGKEYVSLFQTYQYKDSIYKDSAHPLPAASRPGSAQPSTRLASSGARRAWSSAAGSSASVP